MLMKSSQSVFFFLRCIYSFILLKLVLQSSAMGVRVGVLITQHTQVGVFLMQNQSRRKQTCSFPLHMCLHLCHSSVEVNIKCLPKKLLVQSTSLLVSPQRPRRRTVKMLHPPTLQTRLQILPHCCSTTGAVTWVLRVDVLHSRSSATMATIATLVTGSPSPGQFQICDQTGPS